MTKQSITRRDLLKTALAAGGGLTAVAFLPEKWVKPVVQSGVLPVHAAASGTGSIHGIITFGFNSNRSLAYGGGSTGGSKNISELGYPTYYGATITATAGSARFSGGVDEGGTFTINGVLPGTYTLGWEFTGNTCEFHFPASVTVYAGQTTEVEFTGSCSPILPDPS